MRRMNATMLIAGLWLVALPWVAGCTYERVVRDDMDQWRKMATREKVAPLPTSPNLAAGGGWGIELATFTGKRRFADAQRLVEYLKEKAAIQDAWTHDAGTHVAVMRGRYASAADAQAQADLHQTREMEIDTVKRFEKARLIPYGQAEKSAVMPSDLGQFAGMDGYTLQVAVFDAAGGAKFREAAELYCMQLREKNEQAYFYHGPNRSMVTIGLFNDSDLIQSGPVKQYGPRIREVQQRYPNNLVNGSTVVERSGDQVIGDQPSSLVHLPRM